MKSKDLITGKLSEAKAMQEGEDDPRGPEGFDPGDTPRRGGPPGGMRRPMRGPGGPGGPGGGMLNPREREALKGLLMYELLNNAGRDQYYMALVKMVLSGQDPDPGQVQHFLDEAQRYIDLLDDSQKALLDKFSRMPR